MADAIEIVVNAVDNFSGVLGNFGSIMTGLESTLNLVAGAVKGVYDFTSQFVDAAADSEVAVTKLNTVLASTNNSFGLTSEQLQDMATGMQNLSGFSDEAEMSAEAMLLRFENLNGIFPEALQLTNDLAVALGMDLTTAAQMIGKALDDPASGIGRLNTQFKLFTATEMETIKAMAENGDVAGAQALIMDRLREKVGGAAEAFGNTFAGSLAIAKEKLDNMKETIGGVFLPILQQLIDKFMNFMETNPVIQGVLNFFTKWKDMMDAGAPPLAALGLAMSNFQDVSAKLQPFLNELGFAFIIISNALKDGETPLEAFKKGLNELSTAWQGTPLEGIITAIQDFIKTGETEGWGTAISDLFSKIVSGLDIPGKVQGMLDTFTNMLLAYPGWSTIGLVVVESIKGIIKSVLTGLDIIVNQIDWKPFGAALKTALGEIWEGMNSSASDKSFQDWLSGWLRNNILTPFQDFFTHTIPNWFRNLQTSNREWIYGFVDSIAAGFREAFAVFWWDAKLWVNEHIVDPIKKALGIASPSTVFLDIGKDIVNGLINGIIGMATWATDKVKGFLADILAPFKGVLDWLGIDTSAIFGSSGGMSQTNGTKDDNAFPGTTPGGTTTTGTATGGNVFNFYGPIYVGSMEELVYDCATPNPIMNAGSSLITTSTVGA